MTLEDARFILEWFFAGGTMDCREAADVNGNGVNNILSDALYLLAFLFSDGPAPPAPATCDADPDPDSSLGCESFDCT